MSTNITELIKNNKNKLLAGAIICFVGLFWLFLMFGEFFTLHSSNEPDRIKLLAIRNDIQLGDNYEKVLQNFWSKKTKDSRLSISVYSPEEWMISMESEFNATDWRMYIKFKDGKVVSYKIRTSDGPKTKDMPEDIGKVDE
jgi:hypothetical protein